MSSLTKEARPRPWTYAVLGGIAASALSAVGWWKHHGAAWLLLLPVVAVAFGALEMEDRLRSELARRLVSAIYFGLFSGTFIWAFGGSLHHALAFGAFMAVVMPIASAAYDRLVRREA